MRCIISVIAVTAFTAAMMAATALPAFAAADNPNANCVGQNVSNANQLGFGNHGVGGHIASIFARESGGLDSFASTAARSR